MQVDTPKQIGAVTREVHRLDYEGAPARSVIVAQTYQTSAEDLWEAVTTADRIARWLMPITGELKLGGRYQLVGNAGGTILVCQKPRLLKATWEYGGKVSWVTAAIEPLSDASARLTIEHIAHPDEHWSQFGPGAVGIGWDLMVLGLALHLETGASVTEDGLKWAATDGGKEFMRQSNDAWCNADIAGGEVPEVARAAAARTIAAYTGS